MESVLNDGCAIAALIFIKEPGKNYIYVFLNAIIKEKNTLGKKTPKDHPDKVANSAKFH
ncbi:hypothetical protein N9L66_01145 [Porticoccaceae bacterium]|nr:hypothetical protein [Porticoccaceae bacterium]